MRYAFSRYYRLPWRGTIFVRKAFQIRVSLYVGGRYKQLTGGTLYTLDSFNLIHTRRPTPNSL